MTKEEVEQTAKEYSENLWDDWSPTSTRDFIAGAKWMNERQPYSDKDLHEFAEWCSDNDWVYDKTDDYWWNKYYLGMVDKKTTSQLREMWEVETGRREK